MSSRNPWNRKRNAGSSFSNGTKFVEERHISNNKKSVSFPFQNPNELSELRGGQAHLQNSNELSYEDLRVHSFQPSKTNININSATKTHFSNLNANQRKTNQGDMSQVMVTPRPDENEDDDGIKKVSSLEQLRFENNKPQHSKALHYAPKMESVLVRKKKKMRPPMPIVNFIPSGLAPGQKKKAEADSPLPTNTATEPKTPSSKKKPANNCSVFRQSALNRMREKTAWQKVNTAAHEGTEAMSLKKHKTTSSEGQVSGWDRLDPEAMGAGGLTVWVSPGERPVTPPPLELLRCQATITQEQEDRLWRQGLKEQHALEAFHKAQMDRLETENYILSKVSRPRGEMMLRRDQYLPKVTAESTEKDVWYEQRTETPEKFPDWAFFRTEEPSHRHEELFPTRSRVAQGYDVIQDPCGRPTVTDEILRRLGDPRKSISSDEDMSSSSWESGIVADPPVISDLGVKGYEYRVAQDILKGKPDAWDYLDPKLPSVPIVVEKDTVKRGSSGTRPKSPQSSKSKSYSAKQSKQRTKSAKSGLPSVHSFSSDDEAYVESFVGLKFGDANLCYSDDPVRAEKTWIVEVGCSAEVGEKSLSHVFLENTGTTAISYKWVKVTRSDPLETNRYLRPRFIFDDWGGIILPGEIYRAPILYQSRETGYFSQDWRLMTSPEVECGAHVILRMWGVSRQYDPYFLAKDKVDEVIKERIPMNIVSHRVSKIFDYLPLREDSFKEIRFPLITLGVEMFKFHNPFLFYNSACVYRLGKLYEILTSRSNQRSSASLGARLQSVDTGSETTLESPWGEDDQEEEGLEEEDINSLSDITYDSNEKLYDNLVDFSKIPGKSDVGYIISHAAHVISNMIDPDQPHLKERQESLLDAAYDGHDDSASGPGTPSPQKAVPYAPINLANPDFKVENLRRLILSDTGITEMKEAFFQVYSQEIDKLFFKPNKPLDKWPYVVGRGTLTSLCDEFSEYAEGLKEVCIEAEKRYQAAMLQRQLDEQERLKALQMQGSVLSVPSIKEPEDKTSNRNKSIFSSQQSGSKPAKEARGTPREGNKSANAGSPRRMTNNTLNTPGLKSLLGSHTSLRSGQSSQSGQPTFRDMISESRYQNQYYQRLETRMSQLLGAAIDQMVELWSTQPPPPVQVDYREAFTRIRDVKMPVDIVSLLDAPLPPKWVAMAERLKDVKDRKRKRTVGLECDWLSSRRRNSEPVFPK